MPWSALHPAGLVTLGLLVVLLADLLTRGRRPAVPVVLAVLSLVGAALVSALGPRSGEVQLGVLRPDTFSVVFTVFCCVTGAVTIVATTRGEAFRRPGGEFLTMVLASVVGMSVLASTVDLATLYLAFETISIPSYVLVGMRRADRAANEASMKYVLFGAVSSGLMLYGLTLLFGLAGGTSFDALRTAIDAGAASQPAFVVAAVLVFAGFAFKISAVPFHFWAPDVYAGAPAAVGGFLAVASKAAGFAGLIRLLDSLGMSVPKVASGLGPLVPSGVLPTAIGVVAILSMTVGNLGALRQREVKRLLAWSSIAHAGYILLAIAVWSPLALSALVFYLVAYLFMNLAAFLIAGVAIRELGTGDLAAFRGIGRRSGWLAFSFAVVLFSLTGLPPFVGFVAKYTVFSAVLEKGYVWLALIGLLNGAVSLYYYAKVVAYMYLQAPDEEGAPLPRLRLAVVDFALLIALVVPNLLFGLWVSDPYAFAESVGRSFLGAP